MNDFDVSSVLEQMRTLRTEAQGGGLQGVRPTEEAGQTGGVDFAALLRRSVDSVNEAQQSSKNLQQAFVRGEPGIGLEQVMIASQKASLSFQAMKTVHGKLLEAYNEIKRMQV